LPINLELPRDFRTSLFEPRTGRRQSFVLYFKRLLLLVEPLLPIGHELFSMTNVASRRFEMRLGSSHAGRSIRQFALAVQQLCFAEFEFGQSLVGCQPRLALLGFQFRKTNVQLGFALIESLLACREVAR